MRSKAISVLALAVVVLCGMHSAVAQTYSGYLKIDDINGKGPDSLHVTITVPEMSYKTRTIYVVDTVYVDRSAQGQSYVREPRKSQKPARPQYQRPVKPVKPAEPARNSVRSYFATPWMFGVKTNLISDLIAIPYAGFEVQLYDNLSFDLNGWWSKWNIFYPNPQTKIYGAAPEVRWWFGEEMMNRGHFVGLHGMVAWYTLEWKDKDGTTVIYQNGLNDIKDAGSKTPAWSCGVTYGYSLPLDRTGNLGIEFYVGLGYFSYKQKRIIPDEEGWSYFEHQVHDQIGITKIGANLTYRFSLRRVRK